MAKVIKMRVVSEYDDTTVTFKGEKNGVPVIPELLIETPDKMHVSVKPFFIYDRPYLNVSTGLLRFSIPIRKNTSYTLENGLLKSFIASHETLEVLRNVTDFCDASDKFFEERRGPE